MSRSYGYGLMNSKLNTLQSLVLTGSTTPTLQAVVDAGNTTETQIIINNSPPDANKVILDFGYVGVEQVGFHYSQLQNDGVLITDNVVGDYGQLLIDKVEFNQGTYLTKIENTGTALEITAPDINLTGQSVFNIPPHCAIDPTTGIDLANKGYVDSLVGQYSGGFNLYPNYTVTDPTYPTFKSLGQTVIPAAQQTVVNNITSGTQEVARFITLPIGITSIPIGLWDALIYGAVSGINGNVNYYFELWKKTALNANTLLVTSGLSPEVNASPSTNPTSYTMNATITSPISLDLTDRLFMILYVTKTGTNNVNVTTYFQNDYYSFTQSTLNAGTTLLSSNNAWTGTNNFETLGIKTTSIDSASTLAIGGTTASSVTIGRAGQNVNFDGNIKTNTIDIYSPSTLSICSNSGNLALGRVGMTTLNATATDITLGGNVKTSNIDTASAGALSIGATTATSMTIGTTSSTNTAIRGTMITLNGNVKAFNIDLASAGTAQLYTATATGLNIGSAAMTALTINAASTQFANAIRGTGSTLSVSQPIVPTSITYNSGTGTTFAGSVGQRISLSLTAMNITSSALQALTGLSISLTAGVWYVQCQLVYLNQNASNITLQRVIGNIGSGATGNTNNDIAIYSDTDVLLKQTGPTGSQKITTFGGIFATNATTFASVSVECNDPTALLPLRFAGGTTLTAVRIA